VAPVCRNSRDLGLSGGPFIARTLCSDYQQVRGKFLVVTYPCFGQTDGYDRARLGPGRANQRRMSKYGKQVKARLVYTVCYEDNQAISCRSPTARTSLNSASLTGPSYSAKKPSPRSPSAVLVPFPTLRWPRMKSLGKFIPTERRCSIWRPPRRTYSSCAAAIPPPCPP
jgi:hypothetical protein